MENNVGRNEDVCYFISLLESLDEGNSIAINSSWGSGKTFFVKQIQMILGAKNDFYNDDFSASEKEKILKCYNLCCQEHRIDRVESLYLPIYYDAWEYDNDDDPILSIVYEIISTLHNKHEFEKVEINFTKILKAFAESCKIFGLSHFIEALKPDDNLEPITKNRNLKAQVDDFFNLIPEERAKKVVIFIDEIDRCKPTYAIKLLERIKHYFDNDRIIFIFSTDLGELQHSVKCVYGQNFNAYRYLDRFFDLKMPLPKLEIQKHLDTINFENNCFYDKVCTEAINKYNFQCRDIAKYVRYLKMTTYNSAHSSNIRLSPQGAGQGFCLNLVVPVLVGIFIYDINLYANFMRGLDSSPLIEILTSLA